MSCQSGLACFSSCQSLSRIWQQPYRCAQTPAVQVSVTSAVVILPHSILLQTAEGDPRCGGASAQASETAVVGGGASSDYSTRSNLSSLGNVGGKDDGALPKPSSKHSSWYKTFC